MFGALFSTGKSALGALNTSMNFGAGKFVSTGGLGATLGLGVAGATIGAGSSAMLSNGTVDPVTGAVVGGAIGAAALPVAGLTAGVIGSGTVALAKAAPAIGLSMVKGAAAASPYAAGFGALAANSVATKVWDIGSRLINWNEDADVFNKVKFSGPITGAKRGWNSRQYVDFKGAKGLKAKSKAAAQNTKLFTEKLGSSAKGSIINGKMLLGGAALVEGAKKAWSDIEKAKMGQMTGVTNLTPRVPSYADNAGATGDLVFALNANRRG